MTAATTSGSGADSARLPCRPPGCTPDRLNGEFQDENHNTVELKGVN